MYPVTIPVLGYGVHTRSEAYATRYFSTGTANTDLRLIDF